MTYFILEVEDLWKSFGGLTAVSGYQLKLPPDSVYGLIGPNGAGKTTIFNLISGIIKPTRGKIIFKGKDITFWRPDQVVALGLTRTFQNLRLFSSLTVEMNLKIASHLHARCNFWSSLFSFPSFFREEREIKKRVDYILEVFDLVPYREEVDEPSAGMNTQEAEDLAELIRRIKEEFQLTLIIVEHRMSLVMGLAEVVQVIDYGSVIAMGSPER